MAGTVTTARVSLDEWKTIVTSQKAARSLMVKKFLGAILGEPERVEAQSYPVDAQEYRSSGLERILKNLEAPELNAEKAQSCLLKALHFPEIITLDDAFAVKIIAEAAKERDAEFFKQLGKVCSKPNFGIETDRRLKNLWKDQPLRSFILSRWTINTTKLCVHFDANAPIKADNLTPLCFYSKRALAQLCAIRVRNARPHTLHKLASDCLPSVEKISNKLGLISGPKVIKAVQMTKNGLVFVPLKKVIPRKRVFRKTQI